MPAVIGFCMMLGRLTPMTVKKHSLFDLVKLRDCYKYGK